MFKRMTIRGACCPMDLVNEIVITLLRFGVIAGKQLHVTKREFVGRTDAEAALNWFSAQGPRRMRSGGSPPQ